MSTAFTSVLTAVDVFNTSTGIAAEVISAWRERKAIADWRNYPNRSPVSQPVAGETYQRFDPSDEDPWDDMYATNSWRTMIRQLDNSAAPFGESWPEGWTDHTQTPYDGLLTGTVPTWTIANLRTETGLTSGFRRATAWDIDADDWTDYSDGMFSYGYPAYGGGDICGPWLIKDMQDWLTELKWVHATGSLDGSNYPYFNNSGPFSPANTLDVACDIYTLKKSDSTLVFHESLAAANTWPRTGSTVVDTGTYSSTTLWVFKFDFTYSN